MLQFGKSVIRILHGLVECFFHCVFKLVYCGSGQKMPPIKDLLLLESATSIAHKIRTKKITSLQVLESFIARIHEVNPILNCVVAERFEEARKEARAVDDLIKSGAIPEETLAREKPFLGVPFTTKDCIAVKGMIHTSGLAKRRNCIAEEDADAIACLKSAGAFPIALTNVSELCMWWESANTIHGRSNNPYDTNHIVGGSSGGEGCLQGAAGSAFGIGSDIGGSIRMPSFFNGIFGHKPSKFIVSNNGQYPAPITTEQTSFLGIGPMCRRAEDLLPLLKIIAGKNANELKLDEPVDVKKLKFYYQETDGGSVGVSPVNHEIRQLFTKIALHLEKAHAIKAKKVALERFRKSAPIWFANMKSPNGPSFQEQLANLQGSINPYWELVKWVFRRSDHTFIGIVTALADKGGCKYGDDKHTYLVEERGRLRREMEELLGDDGVFLYPTHPTAAPFHNEPLIKPFNFSYTAIINVLGFPATNIPMGLNGEGLPIGVQVVANTKNDRLCLAVARELEKAFGGWVPPEVDA
ncbi:fatty-acid amide hydrolase 2 [Tribolium castaneum]|nr:PREDICTED: fatty-acid amide hydrolase 2 [Tribolium castaneum]|eukprot:XP_968383.1 PREDICTED: fatty-acid amide hydrolase 2 [Tribolium castaneum]